MLGRRGGRRDKDAEESWRCAQCGRLAKFKDGAGGACPCCRWQDAWRRVDEESIDEADCVPHGGHVHEWPDDDRVLIVRPRRGFVCICQTCGDVDPGGVKGRCCGRVRATVRSSRLRFALAPSGERLAYTVQGVREY